MFGNWQERELEQWEKESRTKQIFGKVGDKQQKGNEDGKRKSEQEVGRKQKMYITTFQITIILYSQFSREANAKCVIWVQ